MRGERRARERFQQKSSSEISWRSFRHFSPLFLRTAFLPFYSKARLVHRLRRETLLTSNGSRRRNLTFENLLESAVDVRFNQVSTSLHQGTDRLSREQGSVYNPYPSDDPAARTEVFQFVIEPKKSCVAGWDSLEIRIEESLSTRIACEIDRREAVQQSIVGSCYRMSGRQAKRKREDLRRKANSAAPSATEDWEAKRCSK